MIPEEQRPTTTLRVSETISAFVLRGDLEEAVSHALSIDPFVLLDDWSSLDRSGSEEHFRSFWWAWIEELQQRGPGWCTRLLGVLECFARELSQDLVYGEDTYWQHRHVVLLQTEATQALFVSLLTDDYGWVHDLPTEPIGEETLRRAKALAQTVEALDVLPSIEEDESRRATRGTYWPDGAPHAYSPNGYGR